MNVSLSSDEPAKALQLMARMAPFNPPRLAPRVHKNYAMRLYVAYTGYLCLMASEALYPLYRPSGSQGQLTLGSDEVYIMTIKQQAAVGDRRILEPH